MTKVELQDKGQDLLYFLVDEETCKIEEAGPFHNDLYKGGYIPLDTQRVGEKCMIHHPPHFEYGFLKYNVESITKQ